MSGAVRPELDVPPAPWLPPGKTAAVCFHVDDVHPSRAADGYDAGGELGAGALGHLEWLLERHPQLHLTVFATPDWRERSPVPTRRLLARVPWLRDRLYLAPVWPAGTMRLDRHPALVRYLLAFPRTEVALHGLHHVHRGLDIPAEFQAQGVEECAAMLREGMEIFRAAGLPSPRGMCPPRFSTPSALLDGMTREGLEYVASARDIRSPLAPGARTAMSGLRGVPLLHPVALPGGLVHVPTNFQATSPLERALDAVRAGGLLSIKAHIIKDAFGTVALDGMDDLYRNYLDTLFTLLRDRYGDALWWTTMAGVAAAARAAAPAQAGVA
jgi:hypothetical protein